MSNAVKNIVLCSDGTGNSGGKGNETNVWRTYNAIDLRMEEPEQVAYYDDGVGAQDFKYLKALSGAAGLGFSRNVRQMYRFLVRAYDPDPAVQNKIYLFGFSRGAYTVRAFAAFIAKCGVISSADCPNDKDLDQAIKELVKAYHTAAREGTALQTDINLQSIDDIHFVGVWDTVSAVGAPFGFGFDWLIQRLFKFYFSDLKLNDKVTYARQALALDDERKSFHPLVWDESEENNVEGRLPRIKQVWFAGVHSNVGGGYPKQGMSYEALDWMLDELGACGNESGQTLWLEAGFASDMNRQADVFDKLYDSRSGVAAYYRPKVRNIGQFCLDSGVDEVKVHSSAFRRIEQKGRQYDPVGLPTDLQMIAVPNSSGVCDRANVKDNQKKRAEAAGSLTGLIRSRESAHLSLVFMTLMLVMLVLDEIVENGFALLTSLTALFVGLYVTEAAAQKVTSRRWFVYLFGFALTGSAVWLLWSRMWPDQIFFAQEWYVIPGLMIVIAGRIGWRQWKNKQACFANDPDLKPDEGDPYPRYRRWESVVISLVVISLTVGLYYDIKTMGDPGTPFGSAVEKALKMMLDMVSGALPEGLVNNLGGVLQTYPVWCLAFLLGAAAAFALMRYTRRKIRQTLESSWNVVRED